MTPRPTDRTRRYERRRRGSTPRRGTMYRSVRSSRRRRKVCRLFRIQDIGLVRFQPPRPCGDCKAAGSPTKSHGRERYPDPVPTDRTTAVQPPDERRMLVRIQLGGPSCHVTRSVSRADCRSAERGSTPLRGAPSFASCTRPQSGRPSSKRTEWGARPYACTRPCPVDPDRRLLSDAARCNSAAGYRHARGSLLVRSRVFHTRPRVRFPPRARFSGR